jgi:hypothetical protein
MHMIPVSPAAPLAIASLAAAGAALATVIIRITLCMLAASVRVKSNETQVLCCFLGCLHG